MRHNSFAPLLLLAPATIIAATLRQRELSPATQLSDSWAYSGCYVDSIAVRALNSASQGDGTSMSAQTCTAFCGARGYPVAGLEYGSECWCGTALPSQVATDPATCNMPCSGDSPQVCGGPDRLTVYSRPAFSRTKPSPTGWQSLGCYTDNVSARTLSDPRAAGDQMSVELCASACAGSKYFGVEYAGECFCGDNILNGGTSASDGCNMPCRGDTSEFCGGSNRLNLYQAVQSQPEPVCAPTIQTGGQIFNGGFELGSTWTRNPSTTGISKEVSGLAYEGCYSELISPINPASALRSVAIVSNAGVTPGSVHTFSFYLGRRSSSAGYGALVNMKLTTPAGVVYWGLTFQACAGAQCNLVGTGGTVWKKYQTTIYFNYAQSLPLTITTSWSGATKLDGTDDVFIDGITIT